MNGSTSGCRFNCIVLLCGLAATPSFAASAENTIAPLNYFLHSYGPASTPTMHLGWLFTAILAVIFIIITLLLAGAVFHKRSLEDSRSMGRKSKE